MSVIGTAPVRANAAGVSRPGTFVTIMLPGLKPSLRVVRRGAHRLAGRLRGIHSSRRARRLPVGLESSARVKWSFGHGYRHAAGSSGSQANAAPAGSNKKRGNDRTDEHPCPHGAAIVPARR